MEKNIINIKEEFTIPGTDFILEIGDKIKILESGDERNRLMMASKLFDIISDARVLNQEYIPQVENLLGVSFSQISVIWKDINQKYGSLMIKDEMFLQALDKSNIVLSTQKHSTAINDLYY